MLKSSILISTIMYILKTLEKWYEGSLIHRMMCSIANGLDMLCSGSNLFYFFRHINRILSYSLSYSLLRWIFRLVNTIITWIQEHIVEAVEESIFFDLAKKFQTLDTGFSTFGLMSLSFGLGLLVIYIVSGRADALIGLAFIVLGILTLALSGKIYSKLRASKVMQILSPLYKLTLPDKEAEKWTF